MMKNVLLILHPQMPDAAREAITRVAPAVQTVSARVFVARPTAAIEALRAMPGVVRVLSGGEPPASLPQLDAAERLFAEAWLTSQATAKQRRGDGLDWDTPGMVPPDPKR
jgi:hypothetical protein